MGKSKKSRTAPPAVQQVMMPHFMPGMSPAMPSNLPGMGMGMGMGMAPGMVTAPAMESEQPESSSSESEHREHKDKQPEADEKMLTNCAATMFKFPVKRIRQFITAIVPDLHTLMTEFCKEMLSRTLFAFSGIKPQIHARVGR